MTLRRLLAALALAATAVGAVQVTADSVVRIPAAVIQAWS